MPNIVKFESGRVGPFLDGLKIGPRDDVKLRIRAGVITANVKKPSGRIQSVTAMLNGSFQQLTAFDPTDLSVAERRRIVKKLKKDGLRQTAIADLLGVSQATVSLDLRS